MTAMRVVTNDDKIYLGRDAVSIVRQMRDTQWNAPERKRVWMDEVTERLSHSHGISIPFGATAGEFIDALEKAGVVTVTRVS